VKIIFSPKCLEYSDGHIESPERVEIAYEFLKNKGYKFKKPSPASEKDILSVHTMHHVERIKSGKFFDPDTPAYEGIYDYACLAAGSAILASKEKGFSLMRPPGHHAGKNGIALGAPTLGFCYFNNIAIAVKNLGMRTLILDIDGHHGNGTQEIFLRDPHVTYISLHRGGIYPGTGYESKKNCKNFTFIYPPGNSLYLKTLDKYLKRVNAKKIEVIAISAGFDSHAGDLASLGLTSECYRKIGETLKDLDKPVFGVLEGGYEGKWLAKDLHELIQGLNKY
jgi:acetoin utilization deacetylase AcuC-like enzyme